MTVTVGQIKSNSDSPNAFRAVCLLTAQTTTTGQPSGETAGVAVYKSTTGAPGRTGAVDEGASFPGRASLESTIFVESTASATPSLTLRMWGYLACLNGGTWVPVGATPAGDTLKGTLNAGVAIGPTTGDVILHSEPFLYAGHFDRLFLEVVAISGTGQSVEAWLVTAHRRSF